MFISKNNEGYGVIHRIWSWIRGHETVDLNICIEIKELDKLVSVISKLQNKPVIISNESSKFDKVQQLDQNIAPKQSSIKERKKLEDDPLCAKDVAEIFSADGIKKAIDKTGKDVVSHSHGENIDSQISSLKRFGSIKEKEHKNE